MDQNYCQMSYQDKSQDTSHFVIFWLKNFNIGKYLIALYYLKSIINQMGLFILFLLVVSAVCFDNLVTPNVSPEAQNLYNYLVSVNEKFVLSGQTSTYYDDLVKKVGKHPLIRAFDMQNYSPHNPWYNWNPYDDGTVASAINWYRSTNGKGIVTFHWHWFSPSGGNLQTSTFYTNYTNFDVERAVTANTQENKDTIRDIDAIAIQLQRLQAQKIPIIWRPLHEAGGKWFWWGAKSSNACKALYAMIFNRLTTVHKINNLIWVWSTPQTDWYPGHNTVDMIGFDSYPGSHNYGCNDNMYHQLKNIVGTRKMVHMSENGPIPNWIDCWNKGIKWGYFLSWSDLVFQQNDDGHLNDVFNSYPQVKTIQNK